MSTHEAKVAVVTDFLTNRASLKRTTTLQEIGVVAGQLLSQRQLRRISTPVRRDKIKNVLLAVDKKSFADKGILLSAVVTHFWDNEPGKTFFQSANALGTKPHLGLQQERTFGAFSAPVGVNDNVTVPDDTSELDEEDGVDLDDEPEGERRFNRSEGGRHELAGIAEALATAASGLSEYVGRHRR